MADLDWRGDDVKRLVRENVAVAMGMFGLVVEGEAKRELQKGHGVETGTLRRSIHTAEPGYDWPRDDIAPSEGSPELGGSEVTPSTTGDQIGVQVGSGLSYSMAVHQGHHSFAGYHFITIGLEKAMSRLDSILSRFKVQR
jgi:hypothetical protein